MPDVVLEAGEEISRLTKKYCDSNTERGMLVGSTHTAQILSAVGEVLDNAFGEDKVNSERL